MNNAALAAVKGDARNAKEDTRSAWNKIAPGYDQTVTPTHLRLGEESLRHAGLQKGMQFLDVAAGSGALSIPAARLGAQVLATDHSPVMLELLQERVRKAGLPIETRVMDGHALALDDNNFDMAGSQFGVMLFPDMPRGIAEMTRVVRPGGRVLMTVMGDFKKVEFFHFLINAVQSVRPDFNGPPSDPPPLPFQLGDPERLRKELAATGLKDIKIAMTTEVLEFANGNDMWDWLTRSNPIVGAVLGGLQLTNEEKGVIRQALDRLVRERAGGTGVAKVSGPINIGVGAK